MSAVGQIVTNSDITRQQLVDQLTGFLSPAAADLYVDVLDQPRVISPNEPSAAELMTLGLARILYATGELYALPAEAALSRALRSVTEQWLQAAPDFDAILDTISVVLSRPPDVPRGDAITGIDNVQRVIEASMVEATTSWWLIQPMPLNLTEEELMDESAWIERHETSRHRLQYRAVYDQRLLRFPGFYATVQAEVADGGEVRFANWELPTFMVIVDERSALYFPQPTGPGAQTTDAGHVGLLCLAFEGAFARSIPLRTEEALSPLHVQIQTLVGLGHTTRAIATALGLNERTVRRRINELMDHHGVTTRHGLVAVAATPTAPRPIDPPGGDDTDA